MLDDFRQRDASTDLLSIRNNYMNRYVWIAGTGSYVPEKVMTNTELS